MHIGAGLSVSYKSRRQSPALLSPTYTYHTLDNIINKIKLPRSVHLIQMRRQTQRRQRCPQHPSCHFRFHTGRSHRCCSTAPHSTPRHPRQSPILRRVIDRSRLECRREACVKEHSDICTNGRRVGAGKGT